MTNTTRRALFSGTAGLALSAVAVAAVHMPTEDDQFLAWEREADRLYAAANAKGIGDDECDRLSDLHAAIEDLILETESASLTPARVKASTLARYARASLSDHPQAYDEIVAALRVAGAR